MKFIIAVGEGESAELVAVGDVSPEVLEAEGRRFGLWLLDHGSTPFLRGLEELFEEAELRKKVGLGY